MFHICRGCVIFSTLKTVIESARTFTFELLTLSSEVSDFITFHRNCKKYSCIKSINLSEVLLYYSQSCHLSTA